MSTDHLSTPIVGLMLEPRRVITDERGSVMHMIKLSNSSRPIGEVYFSTVKPGVIKGWKRHKVMWQRFTVPVGEIEFEFIDERPDSKSLGSRFMVRASRENHQLITVPPGIWYSFRCVSHMEAMIVNASDIEHDPGESETRPLNV